MCFSWIDADYCNKLTVLGTEVMPLTLNASVHRRQVEQENTSYLVSCKSLFFFFFFPPWWHNFGHTRLWDAIGLHLQLFVFSCISSSSLTFGCKAKHYQHAAAHKYEESEGLRKHQCKDESHMEHLAHYFFHLSFFSWPYY